ncbi:hypothetical protein ABPG72_012685 [Tetrahymena utriculariae]
MEQFKFAIQTIFILLTLNQIIANYFLKNFLLVKNECLPKLEVLKCTSFTFNDIIIEKSDCFNYYQSVLNCMLEHRDCLEHFYLKAYQENYDDRELYFFYDSCENYCSISKNIDIFEKVYNCFDKNIELLKKI